MLRLALLALGLLACGPRLDVPQATDPASASRGEIRSVERVAGYHEIWVRALDEEGVSQPVVLPGWNPRGYLNNACHRIAVLVTA